MNKISFFLLCLYVFTLPSGTYFDLPHIGVISTIFLVASLITYLLSLGSTKISKEIFIDFYIKRRYFFICCLFFLLAAMTYFWTISPHHTETAIKASIQILLATFLVLSLVDSSKKIQIIIQFFILGGFVSIFGILYSFFFGKSYFQEITRYTITGLNPNDFGLIMALSIPMAWYLISKQKSSVIQWMMSAFIPLSVISIFLTGSRGSFVALLISLLIVPWTYINTSKKVKLFLILTIIIASYFVLFVIPANTVDRIYNIFNSAKSDNLSQRMDIWIASKKFVPYHSAIGVGTGAFRVAIERIMGREHVAHNTLLSILGEEGIIGLSIFIIIIVILIFKISKLQEQEKKTWTIILLTWIIGTSVLSWDYQLITWFLFSLIISTPTKNINENSQS